MNFYLNILGEKLFHLNCLNLKLYVTIDFILKLIAGNKITKNN